MEEKDSGSIGLPEIIDSSDSDSDFDNYGINDYAYEALPDSSPFDIVEQVNPEEERMNAEALKRFDDNYNQEMGGDALEEEIMKMLMKKMKESD